MTKSTLLKFAMLSNAARNAFGWRRIALILFLCGTSGFGSVKGAGPVEEVTGTVIAYDDIKSWTPCYNGECEGSLIVRIDGREQAQSTYVRIDFRFKIGKPPRQLVERRGQWRFKVIRTVNLDEPIYEFIVREKDRFNEERRYPIWKSIPGAEHERLPFGETLRSYSLVKNGFRPITKK